MVTHRLLVLHRKEVCLRVESAIWNRLVLILFVLTHRLSNVALVSSQSLLSVFECAVHPLTRGAELFLDNQFMMWAWQHLLVLLSHVDVIVVNSLIDHLSHVALST